MPANNHLDIVFIDIGEEDFPKVYSDEGRILQKVLTLGYPKIPMFTDFLTAEKATISSKAISRLTPTIGAVSASATYYLAGIDLLLITAKIRGGNSGGPVINDEGCVVGIACQIPNYEGEIGAYDDLGYGIVVPIQYVNQIIEEKSSILSVSKDIFRDFEF